MQFNQASRGQGGFTLIELIVVIVILGILAATALPRFTDMGGEARAAKAQGGRGAVASAAGIYRGKYLANNSTGAVTLDGVTLAASGYPTADSAGIGVAAGGLADYVVGTAAGGVVSITTDSAHAKCGFNYDQATGAVTTTANLSPTIANCQ